jgi:hypothetical protein
MEVKPWRPGLVVLPSVPTNESRSCPLTKSVMVSRMPAIEPRL